MNDLSFWSIKIIVSNAESWSWGLSNWHFSEVVSGAQQGDKIIGNIGTQGLVEGAEVRVVDGP